MREKKASGVCSRDYQAIAICNHYGNHNGAIAIGNGAIAAALLYSTATIYAEFSFGHRSTIFWYPNMGTFEEKNGYKNITLWVPQRKF